MNLTVTFGGRDAFDFAEYDDFVSSAAAKPLVDAAFGEVSLALDSVATTPIPNGSNVSESAVAAASASNLLEKSSIVESSYSDAGSILNASLSQRLC
mmetsp:Transcript_775/g.1774  ORF Transcript_775/g.1774 Transcript_775/m.1774 type:complete len:97 (-) Transcript_775:47-337(-)